MGARAPMGGNLTMARTRLALPALLAGLTLGCAKAEIQDLETKQTGPLPKPPVAIIYDFAASPRCVRRWQAQMRHAAPGCPRPRRRALRR